MSRKGFTLIEILIAISVVSLLAGFTINTFTGSRKRARDTQRKSDIRQYAVALESYTIQTDGFYPVETSTVNLTTFCPTLRLSSCPDDPKEPAQNYLYQSNSTGSKYVVWASLEVSSELWETCSNGLVGTATTEPTDGDCNITGIATPTPTSSPAPTATPSPSPSPSPTPTVSPTPSPSPSPSPTPTPPGDPWWNTAYLYRKKVTIASSQVTATLSNFPVLISITDADLSSKAQADGDDIVFADVNAVKLDHEIERYTSGSGNLVAWVEVASLSSSADTILYMYYGNGTATNQQNTTGTWDDGGLDNFAAVWHLEETSGTHADSVSNPMDATKLGDVDQNVAGKIAGADSFYDGSPTDDDSLATTDSTGSKVDITAALTLEAWILADADGGQNDQRIVHKRGVTVNYSKYGLYRESNETLRIRTGVDSSNWQSTTSASAFTEGVWTHVAVTYDDATDTVKFYINGVNGAGDTSTSHAQVIGTNNDFLEIGGVNGRDARGFRGDIDEVRISNTARSADWIVTEYNNQSSPGTFYTLSSEELVLAPGGAFLAKIQQILTAIAQTTQQVLGIMTEALSPF